MWLQVHCPHFWELINAGKNKEKRISTSMAPNAYPARILRYFRKGTLKVLLSKGSYDQGYIIAYLKLILFCKLYAKRQQFVYFLQKLT